MGAAMTKTTLDDGFDPGLPTDKQPTFRFLINHPTHGWQALPLKRAMAAYHGDARLPEFAGLTIKVALAHVTVESGRVTGLQQLQVSEWVLGSDGQVDQDAVWSSIIARLDMGSGAHPASVAHGLDAPSDDELNAIRLALGC